MKLAPPGGGGLHQILFSPRLCSAGRAAFCKAIRDSGRIHWLRQIRRGNMNQCILEAELVPKG